MPYPVNPDNYIIILDLFEEKIFLEELNDDQQKQVGLNYSKVWDITANGRYNYNFFDEYFLKNFEGTARNHFRRKIDDYTGNPYIPVKHEFLEILLEFIGVRVLPETPKSLVNTRKKKVDYLYNLFAADPSKFVNHNKSEEQAEKKAVTDKHMQPLLNDLTDFAGKLVGVGIENDPLLNSLKKHHVGLILPILKQFLQSRLWDANEIDILTENFILTHLGGSIKYNSKSEKFIQYKHPRKRYAYYQEGFDVSNFEFNFGSDLHFAKCDLQFIEGTILGLSPFLETILQNPLDQQQTITQAFDYLYDLLGVKGVEVLRYNNITLSDVTSTVDLERRIANWIGDYTIVDKLFPSAIKYPLKRNIKVKLKYQLNRWKIDDTIDNNFNQIKLHRGNPTKDGR